MNWGKVASYLGKGFKGLGEVASVGVSAGIDASKLAYKGGKYFADHFMENIPKDERENIVNHILPWRMKQYHSPYAEKWKNFKVFSGDDWKSKAGNAAVKSPVSLAFGAYEKVLMSPGGRIALGLGVAGAGVGLIAGSNSDNIQNADAGTIANGVGDNMSPGITNVNEKNVSTGINQYGADASLVFALHNLRNR